MSTDCPCVRIVEDEPAIRKLFALLVESSGYTSRVYESAEQFMSEDCLSDPGCILVDLELLGLSGTALVEWINGQTDPLPAIVVTGRGSVPLAVHCLKSGATDFLEKPVDSAALLDKVHRAVALDESQRAARRQLAELNRHYATLSLRERQVFQYMADGHSTKQIAGRLKLSPKTVEHYRANVMTKMDADSLAELVRMFVELRVSL